MWSEAVHEWPLIFGGYKERGLNFEADCFESDLTDCGVLVGTPAGDPYPSNDLALVKDWMSTAHGKGTWMMGELLNPPIACKNCIPHCAWAFRMRQMSRLYPLRLR